MAELSDDIFSAKWHRNMCVGMCKVLNLHKKSVASFCEAECKAHSQSALEWD